MRKIIILSFFISAIVFSQSRFSSSSPFVSGLVGAAKVNLSGNSGSNPTSFAFGGSFGIPIVKNLFLYTRTSYTSQSNFQSYYNTAFLNNYFQVSDELTEVNSSFSQLLLNGGLLYNFVLSEEILLGLNGGVSFMVINQEARLRTGRVISSVDNENIWGAFGGLIVEKRWEDSDFSTFFEAQYNYAKSDALYRTNVLSTMNYTFGVRYYLAGR
jgi:hypothetical protein